MISSAFNYRYDAYHFCSRNVCIHRPIFRERLYPAKYFINRYNFQKKAQNARSKQFERGGGTAPSREKKNHVFGVSNLEFMNIL